jgi:ankyrin repeat protein
MTIPEYAVLYWIDHARQSSQTSEDLQKTFKRSPFFKENSLVRNKWLAMYWKLRYGLGESQPSNFTLMHIACESGYTQLAQILVRGYIRDINAIDGIERVPLHWAAIYGHCDVARILLQKGANMNARSGDQLSVLQVAVQYSQKDMVQLLLDAGAAFDTSILHKAQPDIKQLFFAHVPNCQKPTDPG